MASMTEQQHQNNPQVMRPITSPTSPTPDQQLDEALRLNEREQLQQGLLRLTDQQNQQHEPNEQTAVQQWHGGAYPWPSQAATHPQHFYLPHGDPPGWTVSGWTGIQHDVAAVGSALAEAGSNVTQDLAMVGGALAGVQQGVAEAGASVRGWARAVGSVFGASPPMPSLAAPAPQYPLAVSAPRPIAPAFSMAAAQTALVPAPTLLAAPPTSDMNPCLGQGSTFIQASAVP